MKASSESGLWARVTVRVGVESVGMLLVVSPWSLGKTNARSLDSRSFPMTIINAWRRYKKGWYKKCVHAASGLVAGRVTNRRTRAAIAEAAITLITSANRKG